VAWLATGAAILTVILPANSREFYGHEYAFNTEFEIYRLLRDPDITGGQNQCTVLFRHPYNDIGIANPKVIAPMHRYVKCEEDGNCLKEALKGGCVYYFRTAQCYYAPKNWLDPDAGAFPPNKICSAIEREYQLVPVKEARVDIISTYGSMEGLRENGVIGLYKVLAGKK
jgi:hypothetical protein